VAFVSFTWLVLYIRRFEVKIKLLPKYRGVKAYGWLEMYLHAFSTPLYLQGKILRYSLYRRLGWTAERFEYSSEK
jgi:hypothetical protein